MKRVETAISRLMPDIDGKRVLELACGCAEFSIAAAAHAAEVVCFDLDDQRLNPEATHTERLRFEIMDATAMRSPDGSFDTVVLYNAIGHLAHIAEPVLWECLRVVNTTGVVWVVSSFRMDKAVIQETLLPLLDHMELSYSTQADKNEEKLSRHCGIWFNGAYWLFRIVGLYEIRPYRFFRIEKIYEIEPFRSFRIKKIYEIEPFRSFRIEKIYEIGPYPLFRIEKSIRNPGKG